MPYVVYSTNGGTGIWLKEWKGGIVYYEEEYPNILFAKDGEIYDLDGERAMIIGGAYSVDKDYRLMVGEPWFPDEQPSVKIKTYVHTYRCKHASDERDWEYIEKAIELGTSKISFTDHAPFPGNPFGNRMDIEQLPEYLDTLQSLKEKYQDKIIVKIGLEVEYLASFQEYYQELKDNEVLDILMIGQHFFETEQGEYSFHSNNKKDEYIGLAKASIEGMKTGLFTVLAHPDRIFRRKEKWDPALEEISRQMIDTAIANGVMLESNLTSIRRKNQYWSEFWDMVPEGTKIITGVDAHSVSELVTS